ncbi:MAG: hypothetical protein IPK22_28810 [Verrucomicrobiaceae bacterium]|nr:hypothetical protein [Verrucomicrobiaceae bacterium]
MPDYQPPATNEQQLAQQEIHAADNMMDVVDASLRHLDVKDENGGIGAMSKIVYQSIQSNPHLSGQDKQAACCVIGREITRQQVKESERQNAPATFLREPTAQVRFLTAVVEDKAQRYIQSVTNQALQSGRQHNGADPEQANTTRDILNAINEEKHQISDDAVEFLQNCAQEAQSLPNGQMALMRSTLLLTNVCSSIMNATRVTQETDPAAKLTFRANTRVLQNVNNIGNNGADSLDATFLATFDQIATGNKQALRQGAPVPNVLQSLNNKLINAEAKTAQRQQKLEEYLGRKNAVQQTRNLKQQSIDNAANNPNVPEAHRQKQAAAIQKLDHKSVRLDAKIDRQNQKVDRSEQRLDNLKSRIGRH